jgi:hypothetical protein
MLTAVACAKTAFKTQPLSLHLTYLDFQTIADEVQQLGSKLLYASWAQELWQPGGRLLVREFINLSTSGGTELLL